MKYRGLNLLNFYVFLVSEKVTNHSPASNLYVNAKKNIIYNCPIDLRQAYSLESKVFCTVKVASTDN